MCLSFTLIFYHFPKVLFVVISSVEVQTLNQAMHQITWQTFCYLLALKALNSSLCISHREQEQQNIKTPISKEFIWYMHFRLHGESHVVPTMSIPTFLVCQKLHEKLNCVIPRNHSTNKCQPCMLLRNGSGGTHNTVRVFHCHHWLDKFHQVWPLSSNVQLG